MMSPICLVLRKRVNARVWLVFSSGHLCLRFELTILREPEKRLRPRRLKRKNNRAHFVYCLVSCLLFPPFFAIRVA